MPASAELLAGKRAPVALAHRPFIVLFGFDFSSRWLFLREGNAGVDEQYKGGGCWLRISVSRGDRREVSDTDTKRTGPHGSQWHSMNASTGRVMAHNACVWARMHGVVLERKNDWSKDEAATV